MIKDAYAGGDFFPVHRWQGPQQNWFSRRTSTVSFNRRFEGYGKRIGANTETRLITGRVTSIRGFGQSTRRADPLRSGHDHRRCSGP